MLSKLFSRGCCVFIAICPTLPYGVLVCYGSCVCGLFAESVISLSISLGPSRSRISLQRKIINMQVGTPDMQPTSDSRLVNTMWCISHGVHPWPTHHCMHLGVACVATEPVLLLNSVLI